MPAASADGERWSDHSKAHEYLHRVGTLAPRIAGEGVLAEILPEAPERVLDLGCGDGRLADLVLRERPHVAEVVAVDISPPMLDAARERFADDVRVDVRSHDMGTPITALGSFDLIVSGFAIHHLEDDRKRTLFAQIAEQLRPGGVFANLEVIQTATPELQAAFVEAIGRPCGDPEDRLVDIETQLGWMRDAGLRQVDCMWRWRGFALLTGSV
jgi:SAM-dependent methyltransferase